MGENKKWYRAGVSKFVMIMAAFVLTVMIIINTLQLLSIVSNVSSDIFQKNPPIYENSEIFSRQMNMAAHDIQNKISIQKILEEDGTFDENRLVDVMEYAENGNISNKNESGISYTIKDLMKIDSKNVYDEKNNRIVVVCEKPDGKYYYYTLYNFKTLINEGKLKMSADTEYSVKDVLEELGMGDLVEYQEILTDQDNKIQYTAFWSMQYELPTEANMIDGKDLTDIINEKPELNGKFTDVVDNIIYTASDLTEKVYAYKSGMDWSEGTTNLVWVCVNTKNGKIYSNRTEFDEEKDYQKIYEKIESDPNYKYALIGNDFGKFESNIDMQADEIGNLTESDEELLLAVDTRYLIPDRFADTAVLYDQFVGGARKTLILTIVMLAVLIAVLIGLTIVAGKKPGDEKIYLNTFDRWKTELGAASVIFSWLAITSILVTSGLFTTYFDEIYTTECLVYSVYGLITMGLFLLGYMSLVRRIKAGTMWSNSILKICIEGLRMLWKNRSIIARGAVVMAVLILIHWMAFATCMSTPVFFLLALISEGVTVYFVLKKIISQSRIQKGLKEISGGNIDYKIPTEKMNNDEKDMAEAINNINDGMKRAMEQSLKSERMKTELIANVSHDIKTPLTSIINYVDLLKREEIDDPKVQEYLKILEEKSQRLKTLTEDVVEASKASSGNISLEYMDLNLGEIVNQTIGEFTEKFESRQLQIIEEIPEHPVIVSVDGRRVWRVLENIFNNSFKYSMPGTRVYVKLSVENGMAVIAMKNVSEQPLNISADELTERFIRGDESRTTEGSGLGLSIAKSLTEIQGGKFEIQLDGDLFKVFVKFPIKK